MIYTVFVPSLGGVPAKTAQLLPFIKPVIFIVAYETDVSINSLKKFIKENRPTLLCITVIKKCFIMTGNDENHLDDEDLMRIFRLWSLIFNISILAQNQRRLSDQMEPDIKKMCGHGGNFEGIDPNILKEFIFTPSLEPYLVKPKLFR